MSMGCNRTLALWHKKWSTAEVKRSAELNRKERTDDYSVVQNYQLGLLKRRKKRGEGTVIHSLPEANRTGENLAGNIYSGSCSLVKRRRNRQ